MKENTKKVKVAVLYGAGDIRVKWFDKPKLCPRDFLMRVELCGICASDIERWKGEFLITPPQIIGHEFVGIVADTGEEVTEYRNINSGDTVVAEILIPCGLCPACRRGEYNLCYENDTELAIQFGREFGCNIPTNRPPTALWGGFAHYLYVPEKAIVHKYNGWVEWKAAVLTEPLATAVHAVNLSCLHPGQNCVILGPGTIGLCTLVAAKCAGANPIIVVGTGSDTWRLKMARKLGADLTLNASEVTDVVGEIHRITKKNGGVDFVFECSGSSDAQEMAIKFLRKGGTSVWLGVGRKPIPIKGDQIVMRELTIKGSIMSAHGYEAAIKIIHSESFCLSELVTNECSLEDLPEVFEKIHSDAQYGIKTVVNPWK